METENKSVVLGPQEIDAVYRPNVSFVGIEPDAKSPSEMSDAQRLQTPEGQVDLEKAAEEVAGGEVEKKIPSAGEKPSGEKEAELNEEVKPVEKTAEDEKDTKKVQKRINKITFEKHEAIRRAEHAEAKLKERDEELRKASTERAKAEILSKKPNETDFESEAEYYEALGRWSTRSEMLEIESERAPTTNTLPAPTKDLPPEVQAMLKMGSEMYEDFDDAVSKAQTIPQNLVEEAMDTKETAHDIIYYLAKNQDEAVRIAQLSPKAITREIGKIEAGLSAPTNKTETTKDISKESVSSAPSPPDKPPKPKKTTNAPPPIIPVSPGAMTTTADPMKMTNREYRAYRGLTDSGMRKRG